MTFAEAVEFAKAALAEVPGGAQDGMKLLRAAAGMSDSARYYLPPQTPLKAGVEARFREMIAARAARQPVSQILGKRAFYMHEFAVTGAVLDPRPETETLVAQALEQPFERVLDLGTGSGCILLSLLAARGQATGLGTDISQAALDVAMQNAAALGLGDRAALVCSDWFAQVTGSFDLIVSNPPYVAAAEMAGLAPEVRDWEPEQALTDGADGLSAYRSIAAQAAGYLTLGGRLMVEIGPTQGDAVAAFFAQGGMQDIAVLRDLDGRDRVVTGRISA